MVTFSDRSHARKNFLFDPQSKKTYPYQYSKHFNYTLLWYFMTLSAGSNDDFVIIYKYYVKYIFCVDRWLRWFSSKICIGFVQNNPKRYENFTRFCHIDANMWKHLWFGNWLLLINDLSRSLFGCLKFSNSLDRINLYKKTY